MLGRENSCNPPNSFAGDTRRQCDGLAGYPYRLHIVPGSFLCSLHDARVGAGRTGLICFRVPFASSSHPQR